MASINVLLLPFLALMGQVLGHTTSATISHTRVVIGYTIVNPVDATACMKTGTSIGLDQFFTCSRHHCQGIFVANDYSTFGEIPKDVDCVVDANKEAFDRAVKARMPVDSLTHVEKAIPHIHSNWTVNTTIRIYQVEDIVRNTRFKMFIPREFFHCDASQPGCLNLRIKCGRDVGSRTPDVDWSKLANVKGLGSSTKGEDFVITEPSAMNKIHEFSQAINAASALLKKHDGPNRLSGLYRASYISFLGQMVRNAKDTAAKAVGEVAISRLCNLHTEQILRFCQREIMEYLLVIDSYAEFRKELAEQFSLVTYPGVEISTDDFLPRVAERLARDVTRNRAELEALQEGSVIDGIANYSDVRDMEIEALIREIRIAEKNIRNLLEKTPVIKTASDDDCQNPDASRLDPDPYHLSRRHSPRLSPSPEKKACVIR